MEVQHREHSGYLSQVFEELLREDGLTVLGRGLGLRLLVSKFLQLYGDAQRWGNRLVFLLNGQSGEELALKDALLDEGCPSEVLPHVVTNETPAKEREALYRTGGTFIVTSRILIVDFLNGVVDASRVHGFLVHNAHRVHDATTEAFILRVYRQRNSQGFIKAFTDDPETLSGGFGKVEKTMKALHVQKLYLWPRFRADIGTALDAGVSVHVEELHCRLTNKMKQIQDQIVVLLDLCLKELRKSTHLDPNDLTIDNALFKVSLSLWAHLSDSSLFVFHSLHPPPPFLSGVRRDHPTSARLRVV